MLLFEPPLVLLISVLVNVTLLRLLIITLRLLLNRHIPPIRIRLNWTLAAEISTWAHFFVLILTPNLLFGYLAVLLVKLWVLLHTAHWEILVHSQSFGWSTILILLMDILVTWRLVLGHILLILNLIRWWIDSVSLGRSLLLNHKFWGLCLVIIRALVRAGEIIVGRPYVFVSTLIIGKYFSHWHWHFFLLGYCFVMYPLSFHCLVIIFTRVLFHV